MTLSLALAALLPFAQVPFPEPVPIPQRVAYEDALSPEARLPLGHGRFWYSEPGEWQFSASVKDDGLGNPVPDSGPCLSFKSAQTYRPRVRSPHSLAILRGAYLEGPYALEIEAMQTGIETPHRDLCLVFGFQSPEQFFYAHMGMVPDATSSNVFEVNESPRRRIGEIGTKQIDWGRGVWHRLRLECDGTGHARVFVDDMTAPHFEVDLGRPARGQIGFGSFDDAGAFRNLKIWSTSKLPNLSGLADAPPGAARHAWGMSPFGGIAESTVLDPEGVHVRIHAGKSPLWAILVDVDGDGSISTPADRWMPLDRMPPPKPETQHMLPLTEAAVTVDRIAVQPLLDPEGKLAAPYRFRTSIPKQSLAEYQARTLVR